MNTTELNPTLISNEFYSILGYKFYLNPNRYSRILKHLKFQKYILPNANSIQYLSLRLVILSLDNQNSIYNRQVFK